MLRKHETLIRLPTINSKHTEQSSADAINSRNSSLDKGVTTFLLTMIRSSSDTRQEAAISKQDAINAATISKYFLETLKKTKRLFYTPSYRYPMCVHRTTLSEWSALHPISVSRDNFLFQYLNLGISSCQLQAHETTRDMSVPGTNNKLRKANTNQDSLILNERNSFL